MWHLQCSSCKLAQQELNDSRPRTYKDWQRAVWWGQCGGVIFPTWKGGNWISCCRGMFWRADAELLPFCSSCPFSQQNQTSILGPCCPVSNLEAFFFHWMFSLLFIWLFLGKAVRIHVVPPAFFSRPFHKFENNLIIVFKRRKENSFWSKIWMPV